MSIPKCRVNSTAIAHTSSKTARCTMATLMGLATLSDMGVACVLMKPGVTGYQRLNALCNVVSEAGFCMCSNFYSRVEKYICQTYYANTYLQNKLMIVAAILITCVLARARGCTKENHYATKRPLSEPVAGDETDRGTITTSTEAMRREFNAAAAEQRAEMERLAKLLQNVKLDLEACKARAASQATQHTLASAAERRLHDSQMPRVSSQKRLLPNGEEASHTGDSSMPPSPSPKRRLPTPTHG